MIQLFGEQTTLLELFGTAFGIAGVWLTVKENILCFPVGIVNVALYAWLFFQSRLYADAILQVVYIILLAYGWLSWLNGKGIHTKATVTKTNLRTSFVLFLTGLCAALVIGMLFKRNTDASLPYLDSLTMVMSLVAQWMVAQKKIENWLVWIVADALYIGMYIYKELYLTSLLYTIFIILAMIGWRQWKKNLLLKPE